MLYSEEHDGWIYSHPLKFEDPNGRNRWPTYQNPLTKTGQWWFDDRISILYIEDNETFRCPRDARLEEDPDLAYSFGMSFSLTQADKKRRWTVYKKGVYNLWMSALPEKMYLIGDTEHKFFDKHIDPYLRLDRRAPRHGSGMEYVHVMFHDGHVEPLQVDEIYGWVYGRLPWNNNLEFKHTPDPIEPYIPF